MWFNVSGKMLKFGIEDFALITGLRCVGQLENYQVITGSLRLKLKYFKGLENVTKLSVKECFKSKRWDCDEDAVKISFLYFLHHFLLSNLPNKRIPDKHFEIIDSVTCNSYPWGKESFDYTLNSMKEKYTGKSHRGGYVHQGFPTKCSILGCPIALQVWFYEFCGAMEGKFVNRIGIKIPRILNWCSFGKPSMKDLRKDIFSLPSHLLKLKSITPTNGEKENLHLDGLFDKENHIDVDLENYRYDDDDDFQSFRRTNKEIEQSVSSNENKSLQLNEDQVSDVSILKKENILEIVAEVKELRDEIGSVKTQIDRNMVEIRREFQSLRKYFQQRDCSKGKAKIDDYVNESNPYSNEQDSDVDILWVGKTKEPTEGVTCFQEKKGAGSYKDISEYSEKNYHGTEKLTNNLDDEVEIIRVESNKKQRNQELTCSLEREGNEIKEVGGCILVESPQEDTSWNFIAGLNPSQLDALESSAYKAISNQKQSVHLSSGFSVKTEVLDDTPSFHIGISPLCGNVDDLQLSNILSPVKPISEFGSTSNKSLKCKFVKGLCPFVSLDAFDSEDPRIDDFDRWLLLGVNKWRKGKIYVKNNDTIGISLDFSVELVREKIWLYDLRIPGRGISDMHVNVLFYYLRKKVKYGNCCFSKCTTTNNSFDEHLQSLYSRYMSSKCDVFTLKKDREILPIIRGYFTDCSMPWAEVDHVLFPICLSNKRNEWVLARLSFGERKIYLYNSFKTPLKKREARTIVSAYSALLPFFIEFSGFYEIRTDIDLHSGPYVGKNKTDPYTVDEIQNLPFHDNNDSGIFMSVFAEFFMETRDIPINISVDFHRLRYTYCCTDTVNGRLMSSLAVISKLVHKQLYRVLLLLMKM